MLEWGWAIVPSWLSNKLTKEKKEKKKEEASFLWDSQKNKQTQKDPLY